MVPIYAGTVEAMEANQFEFEIVFVNDASTDGSGVLLNQIAAVDSRVVAVELRQPAGPAAALAAGIDYARGVVLVSVDAEQDYNPAELPLLIEKMHRGYDIVSGWKIPAGDPLAAGPIGPELANWAIRKLTGLRLHDFGTHLKACRRDVVRQGSLVGERHPFLPALIGFRGARVAEVPLSGSARSGEDRRAGTGQTFGLLADLISVRVLARYLARPLRHCAMLSLVCFAAGLASLGLLLWGKLGGQGVLPGPELLGLLSVGGVLLGLQMLAAGVIGELFNRLYFGGRERRAYSVSRVIGRSRKAGIV